MSRSGQQKLANHSIKARQEEEENADKMIIINDTQKPLQEFRIFMSSFAQLNVPPIYRKK